MKKQMYVNKPSEVSLLMTQKFRFSMILYTIYPSIPYTDLLGCLQGSHGPPEAEMAGILFVYGSETRKYIEQEICI